MVGHVVPQVSQGNDISASRPVIKNTYHSVPGGDS